MYIYIFLNAVLDTQITLLPLSLSINACTVHMELLFKYKQIQIAIRVPCLFIVTGRSTGAINRMFIYSNGLDYNNSNKCRSTYDHINSTHSTHTHIICILRN